jgi:hypothetical protein
MPRKATDNPVFLAMIGIEELLEPLTDQGKAQVLRWAGDEYGHVLRGGRPERGSDAVLAGPLGEPLVGEPLDAYAHVPDGRPVRAEP